MAPKARDNAYVEKRKEGPSLHKILKQEDERKNFLKDLVKKVDEGEVEAARLKLDLNEQRNLRIRYQREVEALSKQIAEYQEGVKNNSYVAVLIDGDGAIFHEAFLQMPAQGAPAACRRLNENIKDHLKSTGVKEDLPVFARVYADLDNLATAIHQSGIVDYKEKVSRFFEHFTNSRAEFEFINVGFGKENADCKMKKMLEYYYTDPRCERIYFVGCHDGGYSHVLKEHLNNRDQPKKRIFLVETTPAPRLFKWIGFEILSFGDVFRKEPLPTGDSPFFKIAASRVGSNRASDREILPKEGPTCPQAPRRWLPPSHASSASNDGFPPAILQPAKSAKYIYFNKNGARVDPELEEPSQQAKDSYMEKFNALKSADTKQKVFCNSWYLNGQCRWAEECEKVHDVELTEAELLVHREKVRGSLCYNGMKCEDFDCMLSHHCPEGHNCRRKYKCKFVTKEGNLHYDEASLKIVSCLRERTPGAPIKLKLDS
uniref:C3H1-type domain-containing protein n=1 Tax=Bionectria ochroleuca TaxID=29856 RepID=A0A8H7NDY7_BIOOC